MAYLLLPLLAALGFCNGPIVSFNARQGGVSSASAALLSLHLPAGELILDELLLASFHAEDFLPRPVDRAHNEASGKKGSSAVRPYNGALPSPSVESGARWPPRRKKNKTMTHRQARHSSSSSSAAQGLPRVAAAVEVGDQSEVVVGEDGGAKLSTLPNSGGVGGSGGALRNRRVAATERDRLDKPSAPNDATSQQDPLMKPLIPAQGSREPEALSGSFAVASTGDGNSTALESAPKLSADLNHGATLQSERIAVATHAGDESAGAEKLLNEEEVEGCEERRRSGRSNCSMRGAETDDSALGGAGTQDRNGQAEQGDAPTERQSLEWSSTSTDDESNVFVLDNLVDYLGVDGGDENGTDEDEAACNADTGGTCRFVSCYAWRGPTECVTSQCLCQAGYCADSHGVCRGCAHLSVEVHDVSLQSDKAGYYSAVQGFFVASRPVWKQFHGRNWMWYCETHLCWVLSDLAPNDGDCDAGMVSPPSTLTVTPLDLMGTWKIWDGYSWIDDATNEHLRIRCQDSHVQGGRNTFSSVPRGRNSGTESLIVVT